MNILKLDTKMGWLDMPSGFRLYWETSKDHGGRIYYSDEVGGGVLVWDTGIVSPANLLVAIAVEDGLQRKEKHDKGS